MAYTSTVWDMDDDLEGNVQHIAEHGIAKDEVEEVLGKPMGIVASRSSGRPMAFGETSTGRLIVVVYEEIDEQSAYPITAFEIEP